MSFVMQKKWFHIYFFNAQLRGLFGWWWLSVLEPIISLLFLSSVGYGVNSGYHLERNFMSGGFLPSVGQYGKAGIKQFLTVN